MKKQLPKPTPLRLRRESLRTLDRKDLTAPAGGQRIEISVQSLFGGKGCDPGNSGLC